MIKKLLGILLAFMFVVTPVHADSTGDYNIEPIFTSAQRSDVQGYHSFKVTTNGEHTITYRVNNNGDKEIGFDLEILNAYTSPSGIVQYEEKPLGLSIISDKSYEMRQYITGPSSVNVAPKSSKDVTFKLSAPTDKGELLGGIAFVPQGQNAGSTGEHISIQNKMRYIYGVELISPLKDAEKFTFEEPYISQLPSAIYVRLPLENNNPSVVDTKVNWAVYEKDGSEVFNGEQDVRFAPKTKVHFDIPFNSNEIKDLSEYIIKGSVDYNNTIEDVSDEFEFSMRYDTKKEIVYETPEDNDFAQPTIVKSFNWTLAFVAVFCWLLLLILYIMYRKTKKEIREKRELREAYEREQALREEEGE